MKKLVALAIAAFAFTLVPTSAEAHTKLLAASSKNSTKLVSHKHHKHAGKHKKHHHTMA